MNESNRRCVTVISGGLDSVTLAYYLREKGTSQRFISFDYGQKHARELQSASKIAELLDCRHDIIKLEYKREPQHANGFPISLLYPESALTANSGVDIPEGHYAQDNMALTIVPGRNAMMLSIAWSVAVADGCNTIACGVHAGDHAIYPDCRPTFIGALGVALKIGSGLDANVAMMSDAILAPFMYMSKAEILGIGLKLGVPYQHSWTCYKGGSQACGKCGSCCERLEAFAKNQAYDPISYEDREYWRSAVLKHEAAKKGLAFGQMYGKV